MATANKLIFLQKIKWEKGGPIGSFLNYLTKQKKVEKVTKLAESLGLAMTLCGQNGERGHC
jgi:hypothetical protein